MVYRVIIPFREFSLTRDHLTEMLVLFSAFTSKNFGDSEGSNDDKKRCDPLSKMATYDSETPHC